MNQCDDCGKPVESTEVKRGSITLIRTPSYCKTCRTPLRVAQSGYVSPDEIEKRGDALDYTEGRNRQRVIDNRGGSL